VRLAIELCVRDQESHVNRKSIERVILAKNGGNRYRPDCRAKEEWKNRTPPDGHFVDSTQLVKLTAALMAVRHHHSLQRGAI
jgi:hypothetical protein